MYGIKDAATTAVPTVAGAATLPATGDNTLLFAVVSAVIAIGTIATLVQVGTIFYRRRVLR